MKSPELNTKPYKGCDKKFICSYCNYWIPGIQCDVMQSYKDCEKLVKWNLKGEGK